MSTPLRTSGFSCSRVELPLPTHMRCQSMADRTPLLAQVETLLDLTAPVHALSAYLRNHSQGRCSRSASTPSASNLLARDLLLCIRTRLQKRAESTTGRILSLASADVLVQIRSDLRLRFATFPPARRAITALPLPSPRWPPTFSTRGSTAPWAGPPRIVALQHLPHRMRPSCTPIRSRRRRPAHRRSA
jgi:hypothetical protein